MATRFETLPQLSTLGKALGRAWPGLRPEQLKQALPMEWLALGSVWAASIFMNEAVGGHGIGRLDLALALNRGVLGLLICYFVMPRFLEQGRHGAFLAATGAAIAAFCALHVYGVGPLVHATAGHHFCYRCYLTQTLPTVATMAVIKLSWTLLEQQKQAAVSSRERSEAELRFLRTQMNPHLLFNSLNNVYSYALEKSDRAPEMILKLSGVLRYMLYEAGDGLVPLRRELDYIRDYFELQQLSTEGRGDVSLSIVGEPGHLTIAPLILIVFIENCFKHAVETTDPLFVHVSIRIEGDTLMLEARNNLPAPEAAHAPIRVGGIGLENVRRRLELLYPGRFSLKAQPLGSAYQARLRVALAAR
jgi:LytS/YehU family sensor histidine kinase